MDILLDTHAVLWFFEDDARLSKTAIEAICNPDNQIYVSIATLWEVAIKLSIGKLTLDGGIEDFIESIDENGFSLLEVSTGHIKTVVELPFHHRDPFDRILVAQAIVEEMAVITTDTDVVKYDINSIW